MTDSTISAPSLPGLPLQAHKSTDGLLKIPGPDPRAAPFMNSSREAPLFCRETSRLVEGSPGPSGYSAEGWHSFPISTAEPQVQRTASYSRHQGHERGGERLRFLSLLADVASLDKESWVLFILIHVAQGPSHARI